MWISATPQHHLFCDVQLFVVLKQRLQGLLGPPHRPPAQRAAVAAAPLQGDLSTREVDFREHCMNRVKSPVESLKKEREAKEQAKNGATELDAKDTPAITDEKPDDGKVAEKPEDRKQDPDSCLIN